MEAELYDNLNELDLNISEWNKNIEDILKRQKKRCLYFKLLHDEEARRLSILNRIFSIISIILVSITATGTSITNDPNLHNNIWSFYVNIIYSVLLYSSAIISSIQNFYGFDKNSEKNNLTSLRYAALFYNIKRMLSLDRESRFEAEKYFLWANKEFDNIFLKAPIVSKKIYKKFEKKFCKETTENYLSLDIEDKSINDYNDKELENVKYELERFMDHNLNIYN